MCRPLLLSFQCFFWCALLHPHPTGGLNLDPLSPTVVSSGLLEGSDEGFGWTLTQHVFGDGRKSVLVSAPRAGGDVGQEGGVYNCPFDVGSSCQFQKLFQNRNISSDNPFLSGLKDDARSIDGQLLGYSLKSAGGVVIACAPLYVHTIASTSFAGENYLTGNPNGRCVILNSDLNTTSQAYPERLGNLMLAGLDVEILQPSGSSSFVLSNTFAGAGRTRGGQLILSNGVSGMNINDDQSSITPQVPVDSLFGFHLESGQFTQLGTPEIVTSSPRGNQHHGKVEVFDSGNLQAGPQLTFRGNEADGYFGYDFAVLDLGHQGFSSLAVGCPLCDRERGRVYIYAHTGNPSAPFVESVIAAPPPFSERGRFGLAVENIGDIDLDGLSDIAVSAPYQGAGKVYIYRGSESGVVSGDFQTLEAVEGAMAFGYSLSGGLDIDNNGYPDLSVGDLGGGRVTTLRGSPLANMTLLFRDRKETLDITGSFDRLCPLDGVTLHCFNVTPCFYYEAKVGNVPQIALQYNLTVDEGKSRVSTYSVGEGGVVTLGAPVLSGTATITGPGSDNMACAAAVTFALNANFVDIDSIPVSLSVTDAPTLLEASADTDAQFGGPLHPVLMRYTRGDVRAPLTLDYQISSNVNCSAGDPVLCEGTFSLAVSDTMGAAMGADNRLLLASSNEFGYRLNITNTAEDTAVNPVLIIKLPQQTLLKRTEPAVACQLVRLANNGSILQCPLKNPTSSGEVLTMATYFVFNDTSALLGSGQLEISFSVRDGGTGLLSQPVVRVIELEAISEYSLFSRIAQETYRAARSAVVFPDPSTLSLDQLGPQITLMVTVQNSRTTTTGATFPRSTLYLHVPLDLQKGEGQGAGPLLVPFSVLIADVGSNVNCSQFEAVSDQLSPIQRPVDFLPPWTGPRPPASPECERNGTLRCGTIICTIFDLKPLPEPPTVLTLFARLYSPSVNEKDEKVTIFSQILSDTENPRIGNNSDGMSSATFVLSPGDREVPRECIRYWVVVVSVVIGIFAVVVIIVFLSMCGLFQRWYKHKQEDGDGVEQTDQELTFQRRTIPPIPQLTNGTSPAPEEAWHNGYPDKKLEKELEADDEFQQELEAMADAGLPSPPPLASGDVYPATDLATDLETPDLGEGLETDL